MEQAAQQPQPVPGQAAVTGQGGAGGGASGAKAVLATTNLQNSGAELSWPQVLSLLASLVQND